MNLPHLLCLLLVLYQMLCICPDPQKMFYMSYNAFSKRDHFTDMFNNINKQVQTYDIIYTDPKTQQFYNLTKLQPQLYYNEHNQKEEYVGTTLVYIDSYEVKVTLGKLVMSYQFIYTIDEAKGIAQGYVVADSTYLQKKLLQTEGYLEWDPIIINQLSFSFGLNVEYSSPKLTHDQLTNIGLLLNDQLGDRGFKEKAVFQFNVLYKQYLKKYLNSEQLISTSNIKYSYINVKLDVSNSARDFSLSQDNSKGLESTFQFGLINDQEHCGKLPADFEEGCGGLQEIITIPVLSSLILEGINQGLWDITVDSSWEVPSFQFYMGDLANSISYAGTLPAADKFTVRCSFNKDIPQDFKLQTLDIHRLIATVPSIIILQYQNKDILQIKSDLTIIVRPVAQQQQLKVVVDNTGIYSASFIQLDSNFKVTDYYKACFQFASVVQSLIGHQVFGTGWPIITRRFPSVLVKDDYIVIFDDSQL